MLPFILNIAKKIPAEDATPDNWAYDTLKHIWIDTITNEPAINVMKSTSVETRFGETVVTETREGADQSEITLIQASNFGESTHTATREGADQPEVASMVSSQFGETTVTKASEGTDQSVITNCTEYHNAAYSHF